MGATEAQKRAVKKHQSKQDRGVFYTPKGELETIKTYAQKKGMSLNVYINMLIKKDMEEGK